MKNIFFQLCFKKGDIITITQLDDGGWWEGTFKDKTGWFPSNYVKEYKPPPGSSLQNFNFSDSGMKKNVFITL